MHRSQSDHICCPESSTPDPHDPIPEEPISISITSRLKTSQSPWHSLENSSSSESESPATPATDPQMDEAIDPFKEDTTYASIPESPQKRRASTALISQSPEDVRRILLGNEEVNTKLVEKVCCGGGCCFLDTLEKGPASRSSLPVLVPDNDAFRSLRFKLGPLSLDSELTKTAEVPPETMNFSATSPVSLSKPSTFQQHPPKFVTPHFPFEVFSAKVHHARELTRAGAEKRTYHFDLDVTDYPKESGVVDFVVGGAVGLVGIKFRSTLIVCFMNLEIFTVQ